MIDHLTPAERSKNMTAIRAKDTRPEMLVRRLIYGVGYRYRLHDKGLPGKPDIVFRRRKVVIFVHGCFWHQHSSDSCSARKPKTNTDYWSKKLDRNVKRDARHIEELRSNGWRVLVIWECETKDLDQVRNRFLNFIEDWEA
jgi:DNA mismatch endonuclease, patch repair protein